MKLITELVEDVRVIEEATEGGKKNLFIEGIFLQGNIANKNKRIYNVDVLEKEVNRYTESNIKMGRAYGELGHPDGPGINLDRVSHLIVGLRREGNDFIGKAKIVNTPMGNIVSGLLSDGAKLGVSSRGMGTLKEVSGGIFEVQEDFHLATAADIVADPSAPAAFVNGIMEGVEFWYGSDGRLHKETAAVIAHASIEQLAKAKRLNEENAFKVFKKYLNGLITR